MSDDLMLKCLIAFILGWLASRMMGNGFRVGASIIDQGKSLMDQGELYMGKGYQTADAVVDVFPLGGSGMQEGDVVSN